MGERVRMTIEWDSQSPEQDQAMLDEFHDLLEPVASRVLVLMDGDGPAGAGGK